MAWDRRLALSDSVRILELYFKFYTVTSEYHL